MARRSAPMRCSAEGISASLCCPCPARLWSVWSARAWATSADVLAPLRSPMACCTRHCRLLLPTSACQRCCSAPCWWKESWAMSSACRQALQTLAPAYNHQVPSAMAQLRSCIGHPWIGPCRQKTTIGLACRSAEIHNRQCAAQQFCIVLNADFPCPSSEWV